MNDYHVTTDFLIIPFDKISFIKHEFDKKNIRVVFDNGCEENLDEDEIHIYKDYRNWKDLIFAYKFGVIKADSEHKIVFKASGND